MVREMESCDPNSFLKMSIDDYCEYLTSKYTEVAPTLHKKGAYILKQEEIRKNGSERPSIKSASMLTGEVILTIAIPFEGNCALFDCIPSTYTMSPEGKVEGQEIHLQYRTRDLDPEAIRQENQRRIEQIEKYLKWIESDVKKHNNWIIQNVKQQVINRKQKVLKTQGFLESIGLPIKRSDDLPNTYTIPVTRKKIIILRPAVTAEPYKPEPTLEETEYEYILGTISNMSLAMERSPSTFTRLHEEEIRDFFLIILNSHYEGQATGETFNVCGKTDILIRSKGKNAFIAECKIWDGPKTLTDAIEQILSYSNWRDTKTAILLFSKNKDFSRVISKVDETVKSNKCYKKRHILRNKELDNETIFSYLFHQPNDRNREMIITIMVFNISQRVLS